MHLVHDVSARLFALTSRAARFMAGPPGLLENERGAIPVEYIAVFAFVTVAMTVAIVKLGPLGVFARDRQTSVLVPPVPVETLCGLGAGDAFGGALAHGLLNSWAHERTIAFANAAGGIVASRLLCSQAMPYEHEVVELLEGSPA